MTKPGSCLFYTYHPRSGGEHRLLLVGPLGRRLALA